MSEIQSQDGQTTATPPSASSKLSWEPKDYQRRSIQLLLSQTVGGLFLDPGLGKTSVCLATYKILKQQGFASSMLIVAPLRPMYKVWPDEIEKWEDFSDITYTILHGPNRAANVSIDCDISIINPEGLLWLLANGLPRKWDVLVIDESTRFKDSTTKRFKLLKPWLSSFSRRWILTGTPSPNGLEDLFGQMYILDLGRALGRYISHYRMQYFERAGFNLYQWKPRPDAFRQVTEVIQPLIIQLSSEDYLQMPELVYRNMSVELPETVMRQYREVEELFITRMEAGDIVAGSAAVAGIKCRQMANGAVYDAEKNVISIHDEKLEALSSLLEELAGKPTLVLYEFDHDRQRILSRLGPVPVLGSGMSRSTMERTIDEFNAGGIPVLLGHPASMGHGLNLQGSCHHIIWFGITWNLEFYDQAIARIYRQGQKADHVFVYHIVAKDTLDERVLEVLQEKDKTQQGLLKALHRG